MLTYSTGEKVSTSVMGEVDVLSSFKKTIQTIMKTTNATVEKAVELAIETVSGNKAAPEAAGEDVPVAQTSKVTKTFADYFVALQMIDLDLESIITSKETIPATDTATTTTPDINMDNLLDENATKTQRIGQEPSNSEKDARSSQQGNGDDAENDTSIVSKEYQRMASMLPSVQMLGAVVFAQGNDDLNFRAVQAVQSVSLAQVNKGSRISSARLLALVIDPTRAVGLSEVGVIPLHRELHMSHLASQLMISPFARPVVFLPSMSDSKELSFTCGALLKDYFPCSETNGK